MGGCCFGKEQENTKPRTFASLLQWREHKGRSGLQWDLPAVSATFTTLAANIGADFPDFRRVGQHVSPAHPTVRLLDTLRPFRLRVKSSSESNGTYANS